MDTHYEMLVHFDHLFYINKNSLDLHGLCVKLLAESPMLYNRLFVKYHVHFHTILIKQAQKLVQVDALEILCNTL